MKKKDLVTLGVLGVVFLIIFVVMYIVKGNEKDVKEKTEFNDLTLLNDETIFLSISKNINKIAEYSISDSSKISFIVKDDIDYHNYEYTSFKAEQIYVVSRLNLYKYYVKGNYYKDAMDTIPSFIREEYYILNYDIHTASFNIEKIDKERYEGASEEEYIFESINQNDYNRFDYSNLSPKTRAIMYFNDFLDLMYYETKEAYNLLSSDTKSKYFNTYEDFVSFVNNHNNISLKEYSNNDNQIAIKDNYNIEYIFEIGYVLNYNVTINMTEE